LPDFIIPEKMSSLAQFQLSRREKGYLPQETAQRSLLCCYRQSTSQFIVRPRTQLIDLRNTWLAEIQLPKHVSSSWHSIA